MRFSLYQFRARYRPSLFPVKGTKAHTVGWQIVSSLLKARAGRRSAKTKKRTEKLCPLVTYAVARSFQESE